MGVIFALILAFLILLFEAVLRVYNTLWKIASVIIITLLIPIITFLIIM